MRAVIHWACWTGKVKYVADRPTIEGLRYVLLQKFEARIVFEMFDIRPASGQEIVRRHDRVTFSEQCVAEMRPDEPGAACHQGSSLIHISAVCPLVRQAGLRAALARG